MKPLVKLEQKEFDNKDKNLISYKIRGFTVKITTQNNKIQFRALPLFDFDEHSYLFSELVSKVYEMKERLCERIFKLDELIDVIASIIYNRLEKEKWIAEDKNVLIELFTYKLLKLDKLLPLFYDEQINEIYMDKLKSTIYVDHQIFGRCETSIILTEEEIKALISRIKLEHPVSVSYNNPSLKVELRTQHYHLRIAIDFPPLSPNGPTINIRKIRTIPFTLFDLVKLNSFPPIIGAYLITAVNQRKNITIIGEPNSGKTTLANAIDLNTPKNWRKIVIEDAIESVNQQPLGFKQTVIQVDSFDSKDAQYNKTAEILKLLHRSPDWIYLGEIQTKEHTKAMFEALNAGLKGIQTAHSDSIEKLIRRWINYGVSNEDFHSLEVLIIMKREISEKGKISRFIQSIYEVSNNSNNDRPNTLFYTKIYDYKWDPAQINKSLATISFLSDQYPLISLKENEFLKIKNKEL